MLMLQVTLLVFNLIINFFLRGCEVGKNIKEKFEVFLEEGLLDPLLQFILKDPEREIDFKVGKKYFILSKSKIISLITRKIF